MTFAIVALSSTASIPSWSGLTRNRGLFLTLLAPSSCYFPDLALRMRERQLGLDGCSPGYRRLRRIGYVRRPAYIGEPNFLLWDRDRAAWSVDSKNRGSRQRRDVRQLHNG